MDVISSQHIESSEVILLYKKIFKAITVALGMLLLILDTKTAINGAVNGINLCISVLIPSLFPFFFISILLSDLISGTSSPFMRPLGRLLKIPSGAESLFFVGMIGGYPVGAQVVSQAQEKGVLNKDDAARMMGFCSNAGPAFLFGVISTQFPGVSYTWLIWTIILLSTILTAIILPGHKNQKTILQTGTSISLTQAMEKGIKIMASVCGWVVIFRIILTFFERWFLWILPSHLSIIVQMLLELANGCTSLSQIQNVSLRFVLSVAGLSMGGFCVLLQTLSASGITGIGKYIPGKLIQTGISVLLSVPVISLLEIGFSPTKIVTIILVFTALIVILSYYCQKHKIKYGILFNGGV